MDFHVYRWTMDKDGYLWISMEINWCQWLSIDVHEDPWISMDVHRYRWISKKTELFRGRVWQVMCCCGRFDQTNCLAPSSNACLAFLETQMCYFQRNQISLERKVSA